MGSKCARIVGEISLLSFVLILPIVAYSYFFMRRVKYVFKESDEAEAADVDAIAGKSFSAFN